MRPFVRLFFFLLALLPAIFCPTKGQASASAGVEVFPTLRPGDVLLIDLGCYACRMISATTKSPFNHSGLVVDTDADGDGEVWVAQSLSKTEKIPLSNFLQQVKDRGAIMVRRPIELDQIFQTSQSQFMALSMRLKRVFSREFEGLPFDDAFLWDNSGPDGKELLYCSEMVQKALNKILDDDLMPYPMDFSSHMDFWTRYYRGQVPQGLIGNSPASLEREERLMTVWENGQR
jgi:Permuted papain-like amidase enzyme, YaeF/YiiX, C92 family